MFAKVTENYYNTRLPTTYVCHILLTTRDPSVDLDFFGGQRKLSIGVSK